MDFPGIGTTELLSAAGLAVYLIGGFRRAWPTAPAWAFVLAAGIAGQLASLLTLALLGHPWTVQHVAGHIIIGILAASGEPLVKRSNQFAEEQRAANGVKG